MFIALKNTTEKTLNQGKKRVDHLAIFKGPAQVEELH